MTRVRRREAAPDPLDAPQRAAVRAAGGIGLALVGAGASLAWGLLVAALVLVVVRAIVIDLFDDVAWGEGIVTWVEQVDASWAVPIVLVLVLLAVGAIALGCWRSVVRMQRAGVPRAEAVTFRGAAIGVGLQAALSVLTSWLLGLLVLLTGVVGFWIVAALWTLGSIIASTVIGYLAGPRTWLAIARRETLRA